ncbi:unnamed protein product [Mytilus coruscus]|uniref:C-type lectin domain-containing protein n=1 Tax=Mytilus coruscus TaxID=42192 RepID=A0A6J8E125_MYTCO|nr:unnamed protein product [Mytilus coruscus]
MIKLHDHWTVSVLINIKGNNKPKTVYSAISENKTWEEADNYCRTHFNQGRLVHITQYNVNDMFAGFTEGPYWIGLKSKNNQWSWNNGEPFVDGSYGWKRVTNRKLNRNGCIAYVSSDQWSISACNSSQHFICQHTNTSLNSTGKSTSSSHKTLELTTVQKMNTVQMSHRSVGQELTTKSINQQSSIKFSTSSIQRNSKVTVAQSSQKYTSSVGTTMHSSTKGSNISMTISNSTSGFRTTISTTPTRPCIKSHSQNCTLTQNSKTHLARNITGSQSTNQGTQTKIKPAQTLTKTSTNPLTFTVVTTLKTTQTSKNPPASSHTSIIIKKITNLLKTRNVTMNRFLSTVNSTQSVKGTKTDGVWLKTSKKTVHTTNIRSAVTEAPTGTNQDADLVLILVLVLTLPLFVLCCITLMYCLLRTKIRRRWSKKNDIKSTPSYKSEEPSKFYNLDNKQSNRSWITHWLAHTNSSLQSDPSNISLPPDYATAMKISKEAYDIPRASLHGSMDKLSLYSESSRTIIEPTTDSLDPYVHRSRLKKNTSDIVFIPLCDYPR